MIISADSNLTTLLDFQYKPLFKAQRAEHGKGANKHGRNGKPVHVKVPLGTIVKDLQSGDILADLTEEGQSVVAARGGRGGRGNARFGSATNQAPRQWESGEFGEEREVELELKLIADVGLVGLPNAGKSTLISRLSKARPKIAAYPFTTLKPNLGIVKYRDFDSFVVADIPGLIEGAHQGRGLGFQFLRHIERTKVLLLLLDCTANKIEDDFLALRRELERYNADLLKRVHFAVLTKLDVSRDVDVSLLEETFGMPVHQISSITGEGLQTLKDLIWQQLQHLRRDEPK